MTLQSPNLSVLWFNFEYIIENISVLGKKYLESSLLHGFALFLTLQSPNLQIDCILLYNMSLEDSLLHLYSLTPNGAINKIKLN